jgi:hypothetical protein
MGVANVSKICKGGFEMHGSGCLVYEFPCPFPDNVDTQDLISGLVRKGFDPSIYFGCSPGSPVCPKVKNPLLKGSSRGH